MVMSRNILVVLAVVLLLLACEDREKDAMRLVDECDALYDGGEYDAALALVDSLRRTYPEEVGARKKALAVYQKAELAKAKADVAWTDKELLLANEEFRALDSVVRSHKAGGVATADELTRHTRMRMRRDSLQVRFDVQCAKIRYIKQKMRE